MTGDTQAVQLRELYNRHLDLSTDDIRTMVVTFIKESGISLREAGAVYFVPAQFQPDRRCYDKRVETGWR